MLNAIRLTRFAWMLVLPALAGCGRGENVTPETLARARLTWARAAIRDYDLDWTSAGRNNAYYHVTVRGGVVQSIEQVLSDGRTVEMNPGQPKYFGVDGLFETIAEELALSKTERPFGQAKGAKAVLRLNVDPKYGYPRSYRRDVVGSFVPVAIDVVRFNPEPELKRAGSILEPKRELTPIVHNIQDQDRQWSRHAARYDELFLDALDPAVENPVFDALEAVTRPETRTVADLGCGTGPLLPRLVGRFGRVVALDFAPGMIARARQRLGDGAAKVTFETRPMHDLDEYAGAFDVVVAINSLVMPDVRVIDTTLRAIYQSLKPGGQFLGVVPSMDAIHYHTMLLMDQALDRGFEPEEAERTAAFHAEHQYYEFAFGRFQFQGLRQKFWQPFEIRHRMAKAGFASVELGQVLYPWDESVPDQDFADCPRSWDWSFVARP